MLVSPNWLFRVPGVVSLSAVVYIGLSFVYFSFMSFGCFSANISLCSMQLFIKHLPWNDQTARQVPKQMAKNTEKWMVGRQSSFFGDQPQPASCIFLLLNQPIKYPVFCRPNEVLFVPNHSISRNSMWYMCFPRISFLNIALNCRKHKLSAETCCKREWKSHQQGPLVGVGKNEVVHSNTHLQHVRWNTAYGTTTASVLSKRP